MMYAWNDPLLSSIVPLAAATLRGTRESSFNGMERNLMDSMAPYLHGCVNITIVQNTMMFRDCRTFENEP